MKLTQNRIIGVKRNKDKKSEFTDNSSLYRIGGGRVDMIII